MRRIVGIWLAVFAAQPALAQTKDLPRPAALGRLIDCRAITASSDRLACFDKEVAAIDAAERRKELVVVDRAQLKKAQRSLFGLPFPDLGIFKDSSSGAQGAIETTIKQTWRHSDGKWSFELPDGARWAQIDSRELHYDPKPGQSIGIRRAALGSYLANVDRQVAIRVRRIR